MSNKEEILNYLRKLKEQKGKEYFIRNIGLFGSYARDDATPESDIDLFVEMERADAFALIGIMQEVEAQFGKKVDIVQLREKMNPLLKRFILEEGCYA